MQTVGLGPELGDCAALPGGVYTYGEIGIGSCLSGPADLAFVARNGTDWLAITNADPFVVFDSGSVLFLDWAAVVAEMEAGQEEILVHTLPSAVVKTERYVGGAAYNPARGQLYVTERLTEDGRTREGRDDLLIIDVDAAEPAAEGGSLTLQDDPGDVVVSPNGDLAFALNFSDHSVSVLDTSTRLVRPIDLVGDASLEEVEVVRASGGVADLDRLLIADPDRVVDDLWTLSWVPSAVRVLAPDGIHLDRWSSVGGDYLASPVGNEVDPTESPTSAPSLWDPFVAFSQVDATQPALVELDLFFSGPISDDRDAIFFGQNVNLSDDWTLYPTPVIVGGDPGSWDFSVAGPSIALLADVGVMFYEGRATLEGPASVGIAPQDVAGLFRPREEPLWIPPAGESYEQPYAQRDGRRFSTRVWLSHFVDGRYRIAHAEFDRSDGVLPDLNTFTTPPPTDILDLQTQSIAAPSVRFVDGEYVLWAARDDGDRWTHVTATSPDGLQWGPLTDRFVSTAPYDARRPPRLGVQHDEGSFWRVRGLDQGDQNLPAYAGLRVVDVRHGTTFSVASGHAVSSDALLPRGRAHRAMLPSSAISTVFGARVYVTTTGLDERDRLATLERSAEGEWSVRTQDLIPPNRGGNTAGVRAPVVTAVSGGHVMFYTAVTTQGSQLRVATSSDGGVRWTPVGDALLPGDRPEFLAAEIEAHSIETQEDGSHRLWVSGFDGSRWRIGAFRVDGLDASAPHTARFTLEPLPGAPASAQLGEGLPGGADDSGVRNPTVFEDNGERVMLYAGFDGAVWNLCRAVWSDADQAWRRDIGRSIGATLPAMSGTFGAFDVGGVSHPVRIAEGEIVYAGFDTRDTDTIGRLGEATLVGRHAHARLRQPDAGDTLAFESNRGTDRGASVIELQQTVDRFLSSGFGTTSLIQDEDRGFLYIPSKISNLLYVVDIRQDVLAGSPDRNAFDLETLVRFDTVQNNAGFRGGVIDEARDRLYLTTRTPESLAVLDLQRIIDNDVKEVTESAFIGTLPLQTQIQDRGGASVAAIGGAQPVLVGDLLVVPNFKDNSLSVFDMSLGPYGAEVGYVPWVGENPHVAAVSPDGRYVVVANYLGDLDDGQSSSTLAILDVDPTSPDYLTVKHWIKNR